MDETVKVGDEVFVRNNGRRAIVESMNKLAGLYMLRDGNRSTECCYRHEFIPVKWMDDKVGNTGIGVCAKNGSEN